MGPSQALTVMIRPLTPPLLIRFATFSGDPPSMISVFSAIALCSVSSIACTDSIWPGNLPVSVSRAASLPIPELWRSLTSDPPLTGSVIAMSPILPDSAFESSSLSFTFCMAATVFSSLALTTRHPSTAIDSISCVPVAAETALYSRTESWFSSCRSRSATFGRGPDAWPRSIHFPL